MNISERLLRLAQEAEAEQGAGFCQIDGIARQNQEKVMRAFQKYGVADHYFGSTSGYGYDDKGRETLDLIFSEVMGARAGFVRHSIVSGTHALAIALFGLLRPGDELLSVTGKPYDTLEQVIGMNGADGNGSLADFGVSYRQVDFTPDGDIDFDGIRRALRKQTKAVFVQRSKGYAVRKTLSVADIGEIVQFVRQRSDAFVVVDNCYGEFCQTLEPAETGADLVVGSLIKNPGGGMAESGGYLVGTPRAVELASYRLTCPGIGLECGATLSQNKSLYKGLFYAPHTVGQAMKTALFASALFTRLGYACSPAPGEARYDIIQMLHLGSPEKVRAFCAGIQSGSPVDSHAAPEPWPMPGYSCEVIMAAGTFVQGASIELSADAPMREPYTVYLQGGLTYESGRYGVLRAAQEMLDRTEEEKRGSR